MNEIGATYKAPEVYITQDNPSIARYEGQFYIEYLEKKGVKYNARSNEEIDKKSVYSILDVQKIPPLPLQFGKELIILRF